MAQMFFSSTEMTYMVPAEPGQWFSSLSQYAMVEPMGGTKISVGKPDRSEDEPLVCRIFNLVGCRFACMTEQYSLQPFALRRSTVRNAKCERRLWH
jgi:hypothetical protein